MVFTLECLIKICAFGFIICGPTSYLRSWANVFDFVIVLAALLSMGTASEDSGGGATQILGKLKTLRVLRVIRPLRLISRSV
jgi:hypothetical protein